MIGSTLERVPPPAARDHPSAPLGEIVLAGHYDPAMIASLMKPEDAAPLSALAGPPAVPIHQLAAGFSQRGISATVLGGLRGGPAVSISAHPLSAVLYPTRSTRAFTLTGFRREQKRVLDCLRQIRPAIVHTHWTMEASRAVGDWPGPKILTVHDALFEYARLDWRWHPGAMGYKLRWIANTLSTLKRFDHVIAVSPFVETYLRLTHRYRGEIRVIPNAVPPLPFVRARSGRPRTGCLTFACYGTPDPLKNVNAARAAFLLIQKELPASRLLVFGSGWTPALNRRYAHPAIEFRGSVRHDRFLHALASEVDIWVHPARIETQSLAVCEAIQAGCPVIAGRSSGGLPWTLDYGQAGLLVDIEQPAAIAQAMLHLAADRVHAESLVAYGQQMIRDRFDPNRILDLHLAYYQDVVHAWHRKGKS